MDDGDIDVPAAVVFLGFELLVDLLRPAVAGPGADGLDGDARMVFLEHRAEIILNVVDHVLVAGGDEAERRPLLRRRLRCGQLAKDNPRQRRENDADPLHFASLAHYDSG